MAEIYNFFGDIFDYFRETYWEAEFGVYQNFNVSLFGITLGQLVILSMLAFILASLAVMYQRRYLGALVRALYAREAFEEGRALTLADLGLDKKRLLRFELSRPQTVLRKSLRYVGEGEPVYTDEKGRTRYRTREVLDFTHARFYLPEGLRERAIIRFSEKGTGWPSFFLVVLACIAAAILLIRGLPTVLSWADELITMLNG